MNATTITSAERWRARLLVLVAAIFWSMSGVLAKAPDFAEWRAHEAGGPAMAFWRALFASVVLLPMIRRPQWSWKLVPMSLTFAVMNFVYLTAMAKGSAANAIWLQNTGPMIVLLVGVLVLRDQARGLDWLMAALSSVGIALILYSEYTHSQPDGKNSFDAVLYGLASGVTYAGVVLSLRMLRDLDSAWLVALNHVVTALALAPWGLAPLWNSELAFLWPQGRQWLFLAALGILQMGLPYLLFAYALRKLPGHEASGIGLLEPLLVPIWVCVVWGWSENLPAWWTIAGGGLIFAGLVIRYLGSVGEKSAGQS